MGTGRGRDSIINTQYNGTLIHLCQLGEVIELSGRVGVGGVTKKIGKNIILFFNRPPRGVYSA